MQHGRNLVDYATVDLCLVCLHLYAGSTLEQLRLSSTLLNVLLHVPSTRQIVAGYGLTETSPTLLNRVVERNVLGSVGVPPEGTEIKIVDPDTREEVPMGQGGILVRLH